MLEGKGLVINVPGVSAYIRGHAVAHGKADLLAKAGLNQCHVSSVWEARVVYAAKKIQPTVQLERQEPKSQRERPGQFSKTARDDS